MNMKKTMALLMAGAMALSMTACGGNSNEGTQGGNSESSLKYTDIVLGESYADLTETISFYNNRTDMAQDDYAGTTWKQYIAEFNKLYPNITVEVETDSSFADNALLRLQGGDWGDVMFIPAVDKMDLSTYFLPYGTLDELDGKIRSVDNWMYEESCYGIPCMINAQGVLYNKAVFKEAGVTELPTTPEEFMAALKAIDEKTDAIPLYTNYAAQWTMGAWDAYIGASATGDAAYSNQILTHTAEPFADPGDGTHAYNVYKVLYDAVAQGLTEEDYSTTDWEGSKTMMNNGEIGTMVLGSWAFAQMQQAGDHPDDVGYMTFPITVDGKQYAAAGGDYNYGINVKSSETKQQAAMVFVKWMTEKSGFAYNEGGISADSGNDELPDTYADFADVEFVYDEPSLEGEEDLLNTLNADSELMVNAGGNTKIQSIVEHAANKDMSFDDIMAEWNEKWKSALESNGVETLN